MIGVVGSRGYGDDIRGRDYRGVCIYIYIKLAFHVSCVITILSCTCLFLGYS